MKSPDVCTWEGCGQPATTPQLDRDGRKWADLCNHHHAELEEAIGGDVKKMMSSWVKAKGGAKKAAGR